MTSEEEEIGGDIGLLICWEERKRSKVYINIDSYIYIYIYIQLRSGCNSVQYFSSQVGEVLTSQWTLFLNANALIYIYIYSKNTTFVPQKFVTIVTCPIERH